MATISNRRDDVIVQLTPGGALGLAHLSDAELLANTRRLVGSSNQLLAALLSHLAEVEARGVHRTRRCATITCSLLRSMARPSLQTSRYVVAPTTRSRPKATSGASSSPSDEIPSFTKRSPGKRS